MKKLALLAGATLLGSCSPAGPIVRAQIDGGTVVFQSFAPGGWLSGSTEPALLVIDRFVVFSHDGAAWIIERADPKCRTAPNDSTFPITYGRVPRCFAERLPAKPLKPGTIYRADMGYSIIVGGYPSAQPFRLGLTIEKLSAEEERQAYQDWPRETHPDTTHPPPRTNTMTDPENSIGPVPSDIPVSNEGAPVG